MSINISEEYLDELLQAIEPIISQPGTETEEINSIPETLLTEEPTEIIMEDTDSEIDIEQLFLGETASETESESQSTEPVVQDAEDAAVISDLLSSMAEEDIEAAGEYDLSEEDVESMLHSASEMPVEEIDETAYDKDVKELLKQFTEDEDLSDIQEILDKNDNGEALDDSMLDVPDVEVFQLEEDGDEDDENKTEQSVNPIKKLFGGVGRFLKGKKDKKDKKKKNDNEIDDESESIISGEAADAPIHEYEEMEERSLEEMLDADGEDLIIEEDFSDIEQLLTGGTFAEVELSDEEQSLYDEADGASKKKTEKMARKKESIFSKVLNILTEEMDDNPSEKTGITEENLGILEELSKEDKKKAKKDKKKSKKTGKNANPKGDNEESDASKDKQDKKSKKPKKVKVKKEKTEKPRKVEVITKPEKKLPRKRVISTLALCLSIMAAVLILQNEVWKTDNLKEAQIAFDNGDYATCYANLNGVERNNEEEKIYQKSVIVLSVQRKWDSYNNFMAMGNGVEAVNALFEGVVEYREKEALAVEAGVHGQIQVIYQKILNGLHGYGLSETDIEEILSYDSRVAYTKRLDSIVNGTPFTYEDAVEHTDATEPQPLQDILPQEEDFLPEDTTTVTGGQPVAEEAESDNDYEESQGQTTVVGSNPVNVFDAGQNVNGGQNVGSGSTNVSMELDGQSVIVGDF